jgi:hypothetical protein
MGQGYASSTFYKIPILFGVCLSRIPMKNGASLRRKMAEIYALLTQVNLVVR